jgi:hypothetical protein
MTEVSQFYILSHIFISLVGAMLLLVIWYNIRQRFKKLLEEDTSQKRVDKGLLYLSFSVFIWVLSGCWAYVISAFPLENDSIYQLGVHFLSILNNMFLLLALFYFYYAPSFIYNNKKNINKIIIVIVFVSILTFFFSKFYGESNIVNGIKFAGIPDLILSGFLSYLLGISLFRTFDHRGLKVVGIISILVILLMFSSQLPEVFINYGTEFSNTLIRIIAKTSLISLFLVLATSWVIRLAIMPKPNEMTIRFSDWNLVHISIPTKGIFNQTIDFGSKTTQYNNLLKFAIRRKFGEGNSQSILVSLGGEIKSQTYLTRVIGNMNTILNLDKGERLERRDLFTFIGEGRYRLRIIPENITIDKTHLVEFCKLSKNAEYTSFVHTN